MHKSLHTLAHRVTAFGVAALLAASAHGQSAGAWPSKPVRLVIPAPAGGGTADPLGRVLAEGLEKVWGQRVLVDNKPGGSGVIAGTAAAQSPADGYTFLLAPAAMMTTNLLFVKSMPWHPQKNFDPVILFSTVPIVLAIHNKLPATDLPSFVAYAKSNPGTINFGSTGNGTASHLSGELFSQTTQARLTHVPYVAPGQATIDTISGNVQATFQLIPGVVGQVKSGLLRPIAVLSKTRSSSLPAVPTSAEGGQPALLSDSWFSIVTPKGTPPEIIAKVNADINALLKNPEFTQKLQQMGAEPLGGTPAAFAAFLDTEIERWSEIVKNSGVKIQQ